MSQDRCYCCEKCCKNVDQINKCRYKTIRRNGLQENNLYEQACNRLAVLFGRKHGWRFEGWAGYFNPDKDNFQIGSGGLALYGDWVVSIEDIRLDLLMDANEDEYIKYMDASLQEYYTSEQEGRHPLNINYRSWLMGARFNNSNLESSYVKQKRKELERCKKAVDTAREELNKAIIEGL